MYGLIYFSLESEWNCLVVFFCSVIEGYIIARNLFQHKSTQPNETPCSQNWTRCMYFTEQVREYRPLAQQIKFKKCEGTEILGNHHSAFPPHLLPPPSIVILPIFPPPLCPPPPLTLLLFIFSLLLLLLLILPYLYFDYFSINIFFTKDKNNALYPT